MFVIYSYNTVITLLVTEVRNARVAIDGDGWRSTILSSMLLHFYHPVEHAVQQVHFCGTPNTSPKPCPLL